MRLLTIVLLLGLVTQSAAAEEPSPCVARPGVDHLTCSMPLVAPPASYGVHPLDEAHRQRMLGPSWRPGCPINIKDLSLVVVPYVGLNGATHAGEIVVATKHAAAVERIFKRLFEKAFPIERMDPMEAFDGDDARSMDANNTSGFNCRRGARFGEFSRHSFGDAIDLNPLWNPQVKGALVRPPKGAKWLKREAIRPGMAVAGGTAVTAFRAEGFRWGGYWPRPKDYQHFSVSGR